MSRRAEFQPPSLEQLLAGTTDIEGADDLSLINARLNSTEGIDRYKKTSGKTMGTAWVKFHRRVLELLAWDQSDEQSHALSAAFDSFAAGFALGRVAAISEVETLLQRQQESIGVLERRNSEKAVATSERERMKRLNQELMREFPRKTPRYEEIARRLSTKKSPVKAGRVRYAVEGSRGSRCR